MSNNKTDNTADEKYTAFAEKLSDAPVSVQLDMIQQAHEAMYVVEALREIQDSASNPSKSARIKLHDWFHIKLTSLMDLVLPDTAAETYLAWLIYRKQKRIVKIGKELSMLSTSMLLPEDVATTANMTSAFIEKCVHLSMNSDAAVIYDYDVKGATLPAAEAIAAKYDKEYLLKLRRQTGDSNTTEDDDCECPVCQLRRSVLGPMEQDKESKPTRPKKPKLH